ncbi:hypothetical protein E2542_SST16365 [Spatholobus suberectus]|nr:hypothetical protein E2542_SST16365 [Spatholobus suberectus]
MFVRREHRHRRNRIRSQGALKPHYRAPPLPRRANHRDNNTPPLPFATAIAPSERRNWGYSDNGGREGLEEVEEVVHRWSSERACKRSRASRRACDPKFGEIDNVAMKVAKVVLLVGFFVHKFVVLDVEVKKAMLE